MLCPLWLEPVVREAAHEGRGKVLRGIDSKEEGWASSWGSLLEVLQRRVGLEGVRKVQYGRRLLRDNPDHDWLLMSKSSDRDFWEYIN